MVCPCPDGKGNVAEVPAKTKEMVYRAQAPWIKEAIKKELEPKSEGVFRETGGGKGK